QEHLSCAVAHLTDHLLSIRVEPVGDGKTISTKDGYCRRIGRTLTDLLRLANLAGKSIHRHAICLAQFGVVSQRDAAARVKMVERRQSRRRDREKAERNQHLDQSPASLTYESRTNTHNSAIH